MSSKSAHIDPGLVDRLFARLGAIYGHMWLSQFKNDGFLKLAKKEWGETLCTIQEKNIRLAVDECKKNIVMPPTLPMFYQACRAFQPVKPSNYYEACEVAPANPVTVAGCFEKIRAKLADNLSSH